LHQKPVVAQAAAAAAEAAAAVAQWRTQTNKLRRR